MQQFLNGFERLEIILMAGVENIADGQTADEVMEEITDLKQAVQAHSTTCGFVPESVLSVCTVQLSPKLCSLDGADSAPDWKPRQGFINKRKEIEALNSKISKLNLDDGVHYLQVHREGIRIDSKRKKVMHKHYPQKQTWEEPEVFERITFTPESKQRILGNVVKLFKAGLKIKKESSKRE